MFYPGSHERLSTGVGGNTDETGSSDPLAGIGDPIFLSMGGVRTEFYTIRQLGLALNRKPGTIRKLEGEKNIPRAVWRKPAQDPRMRIRLYTRRQIEGLRQLMDEEGILFDKQKSISKTQFPARAMALFAEDRK